MPYVAVLDERHIGRGHHGGGRLGRARGAGGAQQPLRLVEMPRLSGDVGRVAQSAGAFLGVLAQFGGAGQPGH
ncbi:hypothetical protein, partial [Streptomyces sp. Act143]|uniref:hypothetical protein n=1 Tax=Streptomyces sp. Act143 TaxID=2200760 RepID=UPI002814BA3A